ncbi:unnamed protein product, partial [Candidula unifasciata]
YESEPVLDDLDSFAGSEAQASPDISRRKQSLTEFTSSFWRSEENLYPGTGRKDPGKPSFSLIVSFGKKYTVLQQMVEWLELWGSQFHSLGVPGGEKILDITPKIKIHIPAQLIVLALWLLEHKYSPSSTANHGREKSPHGRPSARQNQSSLQFQTSDSAKSLEEVTRSQNAQVLGLSVPPATQEQDEIIHAYTNILDEHEESSSIDVSSLASDELDGNLKTTLNLIRSDDTGGPGLNPPQPKDRGTLAKQHHADAASQNHRNTHSQTDKNSNHPKRQPASDGHPNPVRREDLGGDIASQLQGVIRDELRRIMEAQHYSVLAMMGALDHKPSSDVMTLAVSQTSPPVGQSFVQKQATFQKQSEQHSPHSQMSSTQKNLGRKKEREMVEVESVAETPSHSVTTSRHQHLSQSEHLGAVMENVFLRYPGNAKALNGFKMSLMILCYLWYSVHIVGNCLVSHLCFVIAEGLLMCATCTWVHPISHQNYFTPTTQQFVPPPSTQPLFSYLVPPPQTFPQPRDEQPVPLLSVSAGENPLSGFPLLRILSPGSSFVSSGAALDKMKQKEKIEETRQKLLRQFQEQVLQDKESANQQIQAHQMLRLDTPDELVSQ